MNEEINLKKGEIYEKWMRIRKLEDKDYKATEI